MNRVVRILCPFVTRGARPLSLCKMLLVSRECPLCMSLFKCPCYNITLICLIFPGGRSHQRGRAAVPDLAMGQICDQGGEICHLRLGALGSRSAVHCELSL